MPLVAPTPVLLSPEAYFEWEEAQDGKHEYIDGEVFAMAGGTRAHAKLITNLIVLLANTLREMDCAVYSDALRIQIEDGARYTYPDLSVVCGEEAFADERKTTLTNPTVVVEVLSESTAIYDRGEKTAAYRRIASLQEIVLVEQDRRAVETYSRTAEGTWTLREVTGETLHLASIGAEIAMSDLYAGVEV